MTTPRKDNATTIVFSDVSFDLGISKDIFTERYLKSPPGEYISR